MAIAKVRLNGVTQMDLTQDTIADASHIRQGYVGHLNDGTSATGSYSGGGGIEMPLFTIVKDGIYGTLTSITCRVTARSIRTTATLRLAR